MCGIIGIFNGTDVKDKIKQGLKLMKHRGLDATNSYITKTYGLGHALHAIINHIPQPLENRFVFNGEIYNWKGLNKKYKLETKNDAETTLKLLDKKNIEIIEELDGVFAFAYWDKDKVILARDLIGVKPVWFSHKDSFAFASEKKALEQLGFIDIQELNPRKILAYDIKTNKISYKKRELFRLKPEHNDLDKIKENLKELITDAIKKRIPDKKVGILFSGGIDSTLIAFILKKLGIDFTCYTAALNEPNMKPAEDLIWAQKAAEQLGFKLKIKKLRLTQVENYLKTIVPLIEDSNVVKVGVALPLFLSCEMAKIDKNKVIFSGLGSEEIFAGYERHEKSQNINEECLSGLRKMYERDLYRDDVVSMFNNLELRLPFLDKKLIDYALKIPAQYKIKADIKKYILRLVALDLGLPEEFAFRKKRAAQYGSNFDKALQKLAKKEKTNRSAYLRQFYPSHNLKLGVLFSSGKDSNYALYIMKKQNYEISCLITVNSKNKDSFMFHTPSIDLAKYQAEALELPLIEIETKGEKEKELKDLEKAMKTAKEIYHIDGIVTGALFSTYQRNRIEKISDKIGLKVFSPLWHKDQEEEMRELVDDKFKFIIVSVAAEGLNKDWLGKVITHKDIDKLVELNNKIGLNIAGEGGEFETFVLDSPLFRKELVIKSSKKKIESENTGKLVIEKIEFKKR